MSVAPTVETLTPMPAVPDPELCAGKVVTVALLLVPTTGSVLFTPLTKVGVPVTTFVNVPAPIVGVRLDALKFHCVIVWAVANPLKVTKAASAQWQVFEPERTVSWVVPS